MPLTVGATIEPDGSGINDRTSTEARWWFMKELSSSDSCAEIQRIEKELQVLQELLSEKNREYREMRSAFQRLENQEHIIDTTIEEARKSLSCARCKSLMSSPVVIQGCGHTACGECIRAIYKVADDHNSIGPCPTCFRSMYDCPRSDSALLEIVKILGGDGEPYDPKLWKGWWIEDEE